MKRFLSILAVLTCFTLLADIQPDTFGNFTFGKTSLRWQFYLKGYQNVPLTKDTFQPTKLPKRKDGYDRQGTWNIKGTPVQLKVATKTLGKDHISLKASLHVETEFPPIEQTAYQLRFPQKASALYLDGKRYKFPTQHEKTVLSKHQKVKSIEVVTNKGVLRMTGDSLNLLVQDNTQWSQEYLVRVFLKPSNDGKKLSFDGELAFLPIQSLPIPLGDAANSTYDDEVADDGKGGWTDQGSEIDFRQFPGGKVEYNNVTFQTAVPAPDKNTCIVLAEAKRGAQFKQTATLVLPETSFHNLCLMHASAWPPAAQKTVGTIEVQYRDGTTASLPVKQLRDIGNWWHNSLDWPNAAVIMGYPHGEWDFGLYASSFELGKPAASVTFRIEHGIWMIAGATLTNQSVFFCSDEQPLVVQEDRDWFPVDLRRDTLPGSPLDFSLADGPAGKYGYLQVDKNGHLEFEKRPGKRVKFLGANIVHGSNTVEHKVTDEFVSRLVKNGFNTVRFHHFERQIIDLKADTSMVFDEQKLDNFFYLIAACRNAGLYYTIDLYCSRLLKPGDNIDLVTAPVVHKMKVLAPLFPSAMENWKVYVRKLLTLKNKYTGLTMAEDPALIFVNLMNEDHPMAVLGRRSFDDADAEYKRQFDAYVKEKGIDLKEKPNAYNMWLSDLQVKCIQEMKRFLREELKCRTLITDVNWRPIPEFAPSRQDLDLVDMHQYISHPQFPVRDWTLPHLYAQHSTIAMEALLPRLMMPSRLYRRPFSVTEWNYTNPNIFRAEQGTLMGAYSSLQDWDLIYRFAWSHRAPAIENPAETNGFDSVNDPVAQLSDRIIAALFMGDAVRPATHEILMRVRRDSLERQNSPRTYVNGFPYDNNFQALGLLTRIGTVLEDAPAPGALVLEQEKPVMPSLPKNYQDLLETCKKTGEYDSETGEIHLRAKEQRLWVDTPKALVLSCDSDTKIPNLAVAGVKHAQTFAVLSLDGKALAESRKMLFLHIANVENTNMRFEDKRRRLLHSWGNLPLLVRRADVTVTLQGAPVQIQALRLDGSVLAPVEATCDNGTIQFHANNCAYPGAVFAYLLSR